MGSFKLPSPYCVRPQSQVFTPNFRLSQRVTAILKDGPPKILTVPTPSSFEDDQSIGSGSYISFGSQSQNQQSQRRKTDFMRAYTKKDVYERLQKNIQTAIRPLCKLWHLRLLGMGDD
mmetsp:Transcript_33307/g.48597  ORF Transcript_33307/g.48597 Transcript_33307/m.48597 type:complete len:118 (-) Transcript_33307:115-468(-)